VIAEFREIGSTTARKVRQYDAPSSSAASMSSFGMPRMNAVKSMTAKGTASVESARIRPGMVFSIPIRL